MKSLETLKSLMQQRLKEGDVNPKPSYTLKLFSKGQDEIIKKFGEEAVEVVIAAKNDDNQKLISEIADMLYHLTAICISKNIELNQIDAELLHRLQNGKDSDKVQNYKTQ